jgi:SHS2 domain-containing protein
MPHRFFDHTGDIGVVVEGRTLDDLFEAAAVAFLDIVCDPDTVELRATEDVSLEAAGVEGLLVEWMSELLYRFDVRRLLVRWATVHVDPAGASLRGTVSGEREDPARHRIRVLVKGVTYHGLAVEATPDGWRARVVLDI